MEAGEGRNRRALGDIVNLVAIHGIEGKQQQITQGSCPVTRSLCAQLLANAQAAAENKKRGVVGDVVVEKKILGRLEWNLTVPTPYVFLVRFIKASVPNEPAVENMAYFLAELGMMNYAMVLYYPSMLAASAVYGAHCILDKAPIWNKTLKLHTSFSEKQLMECARALVRFHSCAAENKLRVIYWKYSLAERGAVALLPPAKVLLNVAAAPQ